MRHIPKNNRTLIIIIAVLSVVLAALIGIVIYLEAGEGDQSLPTTPTTVPSAPPIEPTTTPTTAPSAPPIEPTTTPTTAPSAPTTEPTTTPTTSPSAPTTEPTTTPTTAPSAPTTEPTTTPTTAPSNPATEPTEPATPETTDPPETAPEEPKTDLVISTPYCNLYYPAQWRDSVTARTRAEGFGYIVTFTGTTDTAEAELFSIFFVEASNDSFPIGTIVHDGVASDVSLEMYDIEPQVGWASSDADDLGAMQEEVNYLIGKLKENPAFTSVSQQPGGEEPGQDANKDQDLVVSAGWCDLYFPAQWKDAVRYEQILSDAGSIVVFYGMVNEKEAELFAVWFAETGEDCIPVGVLSVDGISMDVSVTMPELPEDGTWSEDEQTLFYSLQEKVNYLLDKLRENPGFTPIEA